MKQISKIYKGLMLLAILSIAGCKKFVEVQPPPTITNGANVYSNDATAAAVLTGLYGTMSNGSFTGGGMTSISLFAGLSADELALFNGTTNPDYLTYYTNGLTSIQTGVSFWNVIYPFIYMTNSVLEGVSKSQGLTQPFRRQLIGEARFIRAFCYFYLVNLYGDVPLVLSTDYTTNALLQRSPKETVWQQIIDDLKLAQELLDAAYLDATLYNHTEERTRPNKWAATALLARAYLYKGDYVNAEAQATTVINNSELFGLSSLADVFTKNNPEAIWQLQPVVPGQNTQDARLFILPSEGPDATSYFTYMGPGLVNAFEVGDNRKTTWVDSVVANDEVFHYPYKYKINAADQPLAEYVMVLRLAEQYIIRAEARAQLGNVAGAVEDLNLIRSRAGLTGYNGAMDKAGLLSAVLHERYVELFTEWGHRWLDLKRTGKVDDIMNIVTTEKGGVWSTNWQWYPIPLTELNADPNLVQNIGY